MRRSLFIFVALFCGSVLTENIPSDSANYAYASTTNPDVAPRAAAYWTLKATDGAYPAETNSKGNPPSGVVFDSAKSMYSGPGVEAHERATSGQDEADTSVRFAGEEGGCLKFTGFESSYDSCLKNPLQCTLTDATNNNAQGFSMSMWINLPQDFNTEPRYILDTGGDEKGSPGIAVYFTGSVDGRQFTHQITVLVSTGAKFWKVVLNGMTKPYAWNNIGIRWSGQTESDSSVIPFGLQVFVNKTSVAWKRYETANTGSAVSNVDAADVVVTLGCKLDGTNTLIGQIDNLAIWYWRLRDSAGGTQKPDTEAKRGQINYFDSTLTFATTDVHVDMDTQEPDMKDTKPLYDKIPWMYTDELMRLRGLNALNTGYLDDVYPAKEGDCRVADPTTWGDGGDDDKPHPVDCADTRTELQAALEMDDEYSGHELAKAIVRVANKAGPDGLGYDDIVYLCDVAVPKSAAKIGAQVTIDHISVGLTYVNLIFALSKLQESVYDGLWKTKMATDKLVGVTDLMIKLDGYLAALTSKYYLTAISSDPALTYTAANNSAVAVVKTRPRDVKNDFLFPDYNLEYTNSDHMRVKFYDFPTKRQESWGRVTDYITFPKSAVVAGYKNTGKEIIMIGKINNKLHDIIPAVIDDRVEGIEGLEFFVNSRILSFTGTPLDKPGVMVTEPITYFVEHVKRQDDQPYRKGAILCVAWGFNEIDSTKLGAWDPDGCSLLETNDTHSLCQCSHMTDFALLMEDHQPVGRMSDVFYYVCYALYGISLLCLIIFMCIIIMAESLHYEVHIVHFNVAAAMFFAIGLYLLTLLANGNRVFMVPCIIVSFFMHYSYSSAYAWCCICSHYVFRAVTTGKLGGKILGYYCYIGWGLPALIVITLAIIDVTRYGIGDRCLGAHNGYFLWIYIGIFLFLCAFVCPMFVVGIVNLNKLHINDATDRSDVTWSLFGTAAYWPIIMLVWVMAMLVYLIPQENQFFDFAFELFNSLQGILIFILIGMLVPSFRKAILSCGRRDDDAAARTEERIQARRKLYVPYFH